MHKLVQMVGTIRDNMDALLTIVSNADFAIAGLMLATCILYAAWRGTDLLLSIIISLLLAGFVYQSFPYHSVIASFFPSAFTPIVSIGLFIALVFIMLSILRRAIGVANGNNRPIHIFIISVVLTALLISFSYHIVPIAPLYDFGDIFDTLFESGASFFWIIAFALLSLFVL